MLRLTTIAVLTVTAMGHWCATASDYSATNANGVRLFSQVPPVGVHPRVLMSPEDLPAWRRHVITTYRGKSFFAKRYQSTRIDQLADIDPACSAEDLLKAYPYTDPGSNHHLMFATLDVIYHQDRAQAKKVCRAVTNFARVVLARSKYDANWGTIEEDVGRIKGLKGIPANLGTLWYRGGADFALAYDYLYNEMTPQQRELCRRALSVATQDLVTWGMGFPPGRAVSNWYGYHGELGPMLLAIEGEQGYRAEQWDKFRAYLLTPDIQRQFVIPSHLRIVEDVQYAYCHLHSTQLHTLDNLLTDDSIRYYQLCPDEGYDLQEIIPVLRKILQHDRCVITHAFFSIDQVDQMIDSLPPEGLYIGVRAESVDRAAELKEQIMVQRGWC